MNLRSCLAFVWMALLVGCGTPSWETGDRDRDAFPAAGESEAGQPASLVEVMFGDGEPEVTKNLPADAADKVGDAIKTMRGKSPPDVTGEP